MYDYHNSVIVSKKKGPEQRTIEWEENRKIGASNVKVIIEGEAFGRTRFDFILEKSGFLDPVKTTDAMNFGTKYEAVGRKIIKILYSKYKYYNCVYIKHQKYDFLGASPDGLLINHEKKKVHLIEIKFPSQRIPSIDSFNLYYHQLQIQMEVCKISNVLFCDFKLKEYKSFNNLQKNVKDYKYVGICSSIQKKHFFLSDDKITYFYITTSIEKLKNYIDDENITEIDLYFCIVDFIIKKVKRNKIWFKKNIDIIKKVWKEIERRKNGEITPDDIDFFSSP